MSSTEEEGGQDYDDFLGFPGDGFKDNDDTDPDETTARDLDGGDTPIDEAGAAGGQGSAKKRKKSVVVPPDDFVTDRIKTLKKTSSGVNREDNQWTTLLREQFHHDTVKDNLTGDRTFKTNHQWVVSTPITNRDGPPKWSWFGVLFILTPFYLFSDRTEYPTV